MINFYSVDDICNGNKENVKDKRALSIGFLLEDNYVQVKLKNLYKNDKIQELSLNGNIENINLYAFTKKYVMSSDIILKGNKYNRIKGIVSPIGDCTEEVSIAGQIPIPIRTEYSFQEIDNDKDMLFILLTDGEFVGIPSSLILQKWQIYQKSDKKKKIELMHNIEKFAVIGLSIFTIINIFKNIRKS